MVNINLAAVNLLPLPALDGFYLLLLALEAARGKKLEKTVGRGWVQSEGACGATRRRALWACAGAGLLRAGRVQHADLSRQSSCKGRGVALPHQDEGSLAPPRLQ